MLRDVEDEARLPSTGGDDDEVGRLQAGRHLIQIHESVGTPVTSSAVPQPLDRGVAVPGRSSDEPFADAVLGNLEDGLLRFVQEQIGILLRFVCVMIRPAEKNQTRRTAFS